MNSSKISTTRFVMMVLAMLFIAACGNHEATPSKEATPVDHTASPADSAGVKTTGIYYCPMHPEIVSDKPGICPKCDMDLELKDQQDSLPKK
jgi:hypothetical protein